MKNIRTYTKEGVEKLMDARRATLPSAEKFGMELRRLLESGEATEAEFLQLQNEGLNEKDLQIAAGFAVKSPVSGLYYSDAIHLGRNLHAAVLSYFKETESEEPDIVALAERSLEFTKDIFEGKYTEEEMEELKSLPDWKEENYDIKISSQKLQQTSFFDEAIKSGRVGQKSS